MGGGGGGRSDVFVWVFLKGHELIHSSKWESHDFFRKKILKYPCPLPPPQIKNVPSPIIIIIIIIIIKYWERN